MADWICGNILKPEHPSKIGYKCTTD